MVGKTCCKAKQILEGQHHQVTSQPSISMSVISLYKTNRDHWGTDRQMRVTWLFPAPHSGRRAKKHPKNPPQEKKAWKRKAGLAACGSADNDASQAQVWICIPWSQETEIFTLVHTEIFTLKHLHQVSPWCYQREQDGEGCLSWHKAGIPIPILNPGHVGFHTL